MMDYLSLSLSLSLILNYIMDTKNVFPILFFYKNENLLEKKNFFSSNTNKKIIYSNLKAFLYNLQNYLQRK